MIDVHRLEFGTLSREPLEDGFPGPTWYCTCGWRLWDYKPRHTLRAWIAWYKHMNRDVER